MTDMDEIWHLLSIQEFCKNQHTEGHTFLMGINKIILMHAQWKCMIYESKEGVVKVSVLHQRVHHMQSCLLN